MDFALVDCCPVPTGRILKAVREVKKQTGATLNSCYRAADAEALLRQCGKQSQAQLYYGWTHHLPGYNPANPPGRSTHECRSDGVAYPGPLGRRLRSWQVGMDWSNAEGVIREFNTHGFHAHVTYPGDPREGHHVNLTKRPSKLALWRYLFRPLKLGSRGRRVRHLTWQLVKLGYLDKRYGRFNETVEKAVRHFQRDHFQKADGIVGVQTTRQLTASMRAWKKKH